MAHDAAPWVAPSAAYGVQRVADMSAYPARSDRREAPENAALDGPIRAVMRAHWASTAPHASLLEAERLMRLARIRQVPVVVDDVLVGLLHHRDVLRASLARLLATEGMPARHGYLGGVLVAAVMDPAPVTATPGEPIRDVARRMLESGAACIPIVDDADDAGRMIGIAVESDLLRLAYAPGGVPA
jgi:CBS domain-containing protein